MSRRVRQDGPLRPGETIALDRGTSHHVLRVLRLPRGAPLVVFDGAGAEFEATLVQVVDGLAHVELARARVAQHASEPRELVLALTKKPAWELSLRMATELGVTAILPVFAERSVPTEDHGDRWERILVSAAEQCGRADLPQLHPTRPLAAQLAQVSAPTRLMLQPSAALGQAPERGGVALLIGPEGGLSASEEALAASAGFQPVGLGPLILRADTAVVAALSRYALTTPRSTH